MKTINNDITEMFVSFEQAKLLKEKGFAIPFHSYYYEDGEFKQHSLTGTNSYYGDPYEFELSEFNENWNDGWLTKKDGNRCFGCNKKQGYFETFTAPTQQLTIDWIRINFDISIDVASYYNPQKLDKRLYEVGISHKNNGFEGLIQNASNRISVDWTISSEKYWLFNTPEEAKSAAILYTLKHLIK